MTELRHVRRVSLRAPNEALVRRGALLLEDALRTTAEVNQLSAAAIERAVTPRQRTLVGLHDPLFYDG